MKIKMLSDNEFTLKETELAYVYTLLEKQYPLDCIRKVHRSILLVPRLMQIGFFESSSEIDLTNPDFKISSVHVGITMRLFNLSDFGLLHSSVLKYWDLFDITALNRIISAFNFSYIRFNHSTSLWISKIVNIEFIEEKGIFDEDPLFSSTLAEEIDYADNILQLAFDYQPQKESPQTKELLNDWFDNLNDLLNDG